MINTYYLIEGNEQIGPFSHTELMERGLSPDEMVLSPLTNEWSAASNLPELNNYFTSQGIYFPTKVNAANFWWRLLAYIIDYVMLIIVFGVAGTFLGFIEAYTGIQTESLFDDSSDLTLKLLLVVCFFLYHSIFESTRAQGSVGKIICQLKVVDAEGRRIRLRRALGRNLAKILSSIMCGIGYLLIFWNDRHQALHDQIAKTYIVRKTN
ncbi:RDD family protein [Mucilaginibacter sp.]|jgi:uncharacterized RDD family membrane protein YckC|uniref:RDD family protein n=1 Tax=Mucilaginibacter sp. TaxID=1882438 RepID=UPI002B5B244B|nr:RDD family protein [Mucilaginibacter sp.]HTI61144.1 RDD family protein [Mucilaginibacter sp.]